MVGKAERRSAIVAISNKYKDTLDDFINSSDKEFSNWLESIDKELCNVKSERSLIGHSERDCRLDSENILEMLLGLEPKIQDFQVY